MTYCDTYNSTSWLTILSAQYNNFVVVIVFVKLGSIKKRLMFGYTTIKIIGCMSTSCDELLYKCPAEMVKSVALTRAGVKP